MSGRLTIAVDGPSGAGKSTLARGLAARFGLSYLDTGRLYRAVAAALLARGADPRDPAAAAEAAERLDPAAALEAPGLRGEATAAAASVVAAMPGVRRALAGYQRRFAAEAPGGAVLDGRDIGTVILPRAPVKIFLTADAGARADRRHNELRARGAASIRRAVLRELAERDERDRARAVAPARPAPDALPLDSTNLDAEAVLAAAVDFVLTRLKDGAAPVAGPPAIRE